MYLHLTIIEARVSPVGTGSLQSECVVRLEYDRFYCSCLGFFSCMLSDVCLGSIPIKMIGYLPVVRGEAANGSPFLLSVFYLSLLHTTTILVARRLIFPGKRVKGKMPG